MALSISTKCGSRVCSARAQNACDSLRWLFLFQRNAGHGFALHAHKTLAILFGGSFYFNEMRVKGLLCTRTKRLRFSSVVLSISTKCGSRVCSARAQSACDSLRWLFPIKNAGQRFALHAHKALAIPFGGSFQLRMRVKGLLCTGHKEC